MANAQNNCRKWTKNYYVVSIPIFLSLILCNFDGHNNGPKGSQVCYCMHVLDTSSGDICLWQYYYEKSLPRHPRIAQLCWKLLDFCAYSKRQHYVTSSVNEFLILLPDQLRMFNDYFRDEWPSRQVTATLKHEEVALCADYSLPVTQTLQET